MKLKDVIECNDETSLKAGLLLSVAVLAQAVEEGKLSKEELQSMIDFIIK